MLLKYTVQLQFCRLGYRFDLFVYKVTTKCGKFVSLVIIYSVQQIHYYEKFHMTECADLHGAQVYIHLLAVIGLSHSLPVV